MIEFGRDEFGNSSWKIKDGKRNSIYKDPNGKKWSLKNKHPLDLDEFSALQKLCQIYFEIASEVLGEQEVKKRRDLKIKEFKNEK